MKVGRWEEMTCRLGHHIDSARPKSSLLSSVTKLSPVYFILVWAITPYRAAAQEFWHQTDGPYGRAVSSLLIDTGGYIVAAAGPAGVLRSSDFGTAWQTLTLPSTCSGSM